MKFTIDRKVWLRGEGMGASRLLRKSDGKQCCIGQVCLRLGAKPELITDVGGLSANMVNSLNRPDVFGNPCSTSWVFSAYAVNDSREISEAARESRLTEIFACAGHEIVFIN